MSPHVIAMARGVVMHQTAAKNIVLRFSSSLARAFNLPKAASWARELRGFRNEVVLRNAQPDEPCHWD